MNTNSTVTDFIIRIKNAANAHRKEVVLPYSKFCKKIAAVLVSEGVLNVVREEKRDEKDVLIGEVRYEKRRPVFSDVVIVSKPSLHVHIPHHKLMARVRRSGSQCVVLSTSKGVMTARDAFKKRIGGEVLFEII